MRMFRYIVQVAGSGVLAATMLTAAMPAVAQDASPAAGASGAACTAEPRDIEELVGLYFGSEGTPLATPSARRSIRKQSCHRESRSTLPSRRRSTRPLPSSSPALMLGSSLVPSP